VAETDSDNDGTPDCVDDCPTDPMKIVEGQCGCFNSELDSDNDGTADCNDNCPSSPIKIEV
jgi:Thrombospondin type 3 repeat